MATNQDVVAALKTVVDGVSNIGQVHAYQRFNADWSTYLNSFKATISGTPQIRGWIVTLEENNPIVGGLEPPARFGSVARRYNALVIGVQGLKDSSNSEDDFLNLGEAVMDALDAKKNLSVTGVVDYAVGPTTMRVFQIRQFGSVTCHYCEIVCPVDVQKAVTQS